MKHHRKKDKVIHTRISQSLEKEIKKEAKSLGISVSNLVRNCLANTFGLVENIVSDSSDIVKSALDPVTSLGKTQYEKKSENQEIKDAPILGWQQAILNLNAVCSECNGILPKGTEAAISITDGNAPKSIICPSCLENIKNNDIPKASGTPPLNDSYI